MKIIILCLFLSFSTSGFTLTFEQYQKKPKLVLVLVVDQFRADNLSKFQKTFIDEKKKETVGGFNFLMKNSAYFPNAEFNVFQSMTCPGHAMIMTGSLPGDNGIVLNEWFDKESNKKVYCVSDGEFKLSPRRLKTTTVGDELKGVNKHSRVFAISLKDRSAIMLGGHRADLALWIDNEEMKWTTSPYYATDIPEWAKNENEKLAGQYKISKANAKEAKNDFASYLGVKVTTDMAVKALAAEKLGLKEDTDILAVSYSTHDMVGHAYGPDSLEVKAIAHVEDREISRLLNAVKKSLGSLDDVVVVLTADHGVAPTVETSKSYKMDSGKIDYAVVYQKVDEGLNAQFGKPGASWIQGHRSLHFYLNQTALNEKKVLKEVVEQEIKKIFKKIPGVREAVTSTEIARGIFPLGELGEQIKRQYIEGISGDVILIPMPFYMEKDENSVTHMTGYSYDRSVPLLIMGKNIKNGIYSGANVIDLAPTLSYLLGILPGATSTGKVLGQIFK